MMESCHGNDKYNYNGKIAADFSSNVWCRPMPPFFFSELQKMLVAIADYPHPHANDLTAFLTDFHQLEQENVFVTNGSVEGIFLLAQAFAGEKSAIIYPCFSEYDMACARFDHQLSFFPNHQFLSVNFNAQNLVWLGNPNNPDGKTFSVSEIENLLTANPSVLFIIDEAFDHLCVGFESSVQLLKRFENLVIIRSFTKAFAIPGLRLGYVLAPARIIDKIKKVSIPWSVNSLAISAGKIILKNYNAFLPDMSELKKLAGYLLSGLARFPQLSVTPSGCNFFLVKMENRSASELKQYLAIQHRILIRDASNFRGLDETYFRLSVQPEESVDNLVHTLKLFFK
jgi:threonine-phosphate decarboxylase